MPIGKMKRLCGWARVPRLNKFLWVFELQLATEIIVFFTMLNKISGIYGILAIFAGAAITLADLILYIYSIFAFVFFLWALEQVRKSRPGGCLLLGYIYLIDMVLNLIFTVHFSVEWFLNPANYILPPAKDQSSQPNTPSKPELRDYDDSGNSAQGHAKPMKTKVLRLAAEMTTAIVTTQLSKKAPIATPIATGTLVGGAHTAGASDPNTKSSLNDVEFFPSIFILIVVWTAKIYSAIVVLSFSRQMAIHANLRLQLEDKSDLYSRVLKWLLLPTYFLPRTNAKRRVTDPVYLAPPEL